MRAVQTFMVDQEQTFSGMAALSAERKMRFGTDEPDLTPDQVQKWAVQVVAGFVDGFGRSQNEVMNVSVASKANPLDGVGQFTPVRLKGLQVGVMDRKDKNGNVMGAQVWYRAEAVESAMPSNSKTAAKDAA